MCLLTVNDRFDPPPTIIQDGWKSFNGTSQAPKFAAYSYKGMMNVPLDKWITAETSKVKASDGKSYEAGFHVYEYENDAKKQVGGLRRVYYRRAHTRGKQDNVSVVIAQEMFVPSDQDAWPPSV